MNVFVNTIVFVKDITISKEFYSNLLGMKIVNDYETIVFFENKMVLHSANSILNTVYKMDIESSNTFQGNKNILLYFETDRLDELFKEISNKVSLIHKIEKQEWGQRVFRFYDPDNHIVEFGEPFRVEVLKEEDC